MIVRGPAAPLLIATLNPGKAREIALLLAGCGRPVTHLGAIAIHDAFAETGATYEENALGKALHYARLSGLIAIADDSGLEVEALEGRPGLHSARYGGGSFDDAGRNRLLLEELAGVPEERRTARYVAVAAIARPDGATRSFSGACTGRIAAAPRGAGGFGYDPLFFYPPLGLTFAEIAPDAKQAVSHRGAAFGRLAAFLQTGAGSRFLAGTEDDATAR